MLASCKPSSFVFHFSREVYVALTNGYIVLDGVPDQTQKLGLVGLSTWVSAPPAWWRSFLNIRIFRHPWSLVFAELGTV